MPVGFYAAWLPRSFTLSTIDQGLFELLNHFFELRAEHIHVDVSRRRRKLFSENEHECA